MHQHEFSFEVTAYDVVNFDGVVVPAAEFDFPDRFSLSVGSSAKGTLYDPCYCFV